MKTFHIVLRGGVWCYNKLMPSRSNVQSIYFIIPVKDKSTALPADLYAKASLAMQGEGVHMHVRHGAVELHKFRSIDAAGQHLVRQGLIRRDRTGIACTGKFIGEVWSK